MAVEMLVLWRMNDNGPTTFNHTSKIARVSGVVFQVDVAITSFIASPI
jgi:hypothetical protein